MALNTVFSQKLLKWFEVNKRSFSWRETRDPFKILVAEILLRKTDAPKVESIYENFVEKFRDPETIANTSLPQLEACLKPLGLYRRRAKELKSLAESLVQKYGGRVPCLKEELLNLPGVGDYTANAVLCFACGANVPLLDTNLIRVLRRVFGHASLRARARTDKQLWAIAGSIVPQGKAREFNLAVLDFAALVCRAKNPRCPTCPLNDMCLAFKGGVPF
jgi:A/G-specific adenine glycosylase